MPLIHRHAKLAQGELLPQYILGHVWAVFYRSRALATLAALLPNSTHHALPGAEGRSKAGHSDECMRGRYRAIHRGPVDTRAVAEHEQIIPFEICKNALIFTPSPFAVWGALCSLPYSHEGALESQDDWHPRRRCGP